MTAHPVDPVQLIARSAIKLLAEEPHVVHVTDSGWSLRHPLSCRPHLFDCPIHAICEGWERMPADEGYYSISPSGSMWQIDPSDTPDWSEIVGALAEAVRVRPATWPTALSEITAERGRQDDRWGEQNHDSVPTLRQPDRPVTVHFGIPTASRARLTCDNAHHAGACTWADIALEEFAEALEAPDDTSRRGELVQLAAVVVAWIECIDRRAGQGISA